MLHTTLTVAEAASYLKKRPRTIRDWIASGKIAARKVGKSYIISEDEIGRLIAPVLRQADFKEPDPTRKARILAMKGSLRGTGLSIDALMASRAEEARLEERKARESGL